MCNFAAPVPDLILVIDFKYVRTFKIIMSGDLNSIEATPVIPDLILVIDFKYVRTFKIIMSGDLNSIEAIVRIYSKPVI